MASHRRFRLALILAALVLVLSGVLQGFTIYSPIALIVEDPQAVAIVHQALQRRFKKIVVRDSLESVRAEARQENGPEVAVVVTSSRDSGSTEAYGIALTSCQVSMAVQILRLPAAQLELSFSASGRGQDCPAALAVASSELSDELVKRLESYRRHGSVDVEEKLRVDLAGVWSVSEKVTLREELKKIPGIRKVLQAPDGDRLVLEIYRQSRLLARDIDRLADVRVTRISDGQLTLASTTGSVSTELAGEATASRAQSVIKDPSDRIDERRRATSPVSIHGTGRSSSGGQKWALVVGISEFADPAVPPLKYSGHDARAFAAVLADSQVGRFAPDKVVLLLDEQATTRHVKMELDRLARISQPEDLFLFYISTHAVPGQLDTAGDAYFVLHDTEKLNLYATGLPMRELVDALSHRIRARTVVSLLDACNTGQVLNRTDDRYVGVKSLEYESEAAAPDSLSWTREWKALTLPTDRFPSAGGYLSGKRIILISSSDGDQPSWESERLGHGFFTYYLIEILKEARGMAKIKTVFNELRHRVRHAVKTEKGALQEPRMFFNQNADIIVGYKPRE